MSLFQKSVEKKYLSNLDAELIDRKYADFQNYFGNPDRQENIRNSKEEQFQEGFLRELFVNTLDYTLNPEPDFNLTTELKNIANSKKADGAILKTINQQGVATPCYEAICVIELRSTDTTDLDKIEAQAFGYKNHHPKCKYVITSNSEKLRFYIQNAVDHVDFDLFNLTREQFSLLWLCLAKDNLLSDLPLKIKESSVLQEESITKKLYVDYSKFREAIYNNLVKNNIGKERNKGLQPFVDGDGGGHSLVVDKGLQPFVDKLTLFRKTQKLLDRFLFILFAEDRLLVPPNSISQIIEKWKDDVDFGDAKPLYETFKKYFHVLHVGRPKSGTRQEIYAYNGGLFKPDDVLDNVTIDDDILYEHTLKLSQYNFETDVDVNILGHIFEHSLGDIENVQAEIALDDATKVPDNNVSDNNGLQPIVSVAHNNLSENNGLQPIDPAVHNKGVQAHNNKGLQPLIEPRSSVQSKRKKDGIFYTPKFITKYIVENTVGKLCEEKRAELGIVDEEYAKGRKNRKKEIIIALDKKLTEYRNWLLSLTILDPACGSGAFLNQALDFLITEHRKIDELKSQLAKKEDNIYALIHSDYTTDILEKNIYGVDLNEDSVEIAKLSLWLRTAQKGRKLNTLTHNIKCGNSLIDGPKVAGEAWGCNPLFNWYTEFPNVFQKKEKKAWHVTWVTHDTRTSERMIKYKVKERRANGEMHVDRSVYLDESDALKVSEIISDIVVEEKYNCLAYNIAEDHVHILLVCDEEELTNIVRKLKGKSAQKFKEHRGLAKDETFNLWAQKFDRRLIESEEQLANTIEYIVNNREKHRQKRNQDALNQGAEAPCSFDCDQQGVVTPCSEMQERFNKGLQPLVKRMTCTRQHAFRTEYKGGFDVVIGNPPYVQLQTMGEMSEKLKSCGYETFDKAADLYCLFTERGYKLLKKGGMQSFIMPNKWMLVAYGKPLRKFLSKTGLRQILNFGDIQFFQDATTYVCIFVVQKGKMQENVKALSLNRKTYHGDFLSEVKANSYDYPSSRFGENEWSIQPHRDFVILEKMKQNGAELKELPVSINYGIKTGYNDAFYIDAETRKKLVAADAKSAGIIKPMVRGRDIAAYGITEREFLINTHNGLKDKTPQIPPINIEDYPEIKKHLDSFYPQLVKRGDKGETPYNLRNCAYLEEFDKPKIMYPNMTSQFPFLYDETGLLSNDKSFILTANDDFVSLPFLTALFNSSPAKLWIWYNCPELQGGTREIRKVYFEHFPVPRANDEQTARLAQLATERSQQTLQLQTAVDGFKNFLKTKIETGKLSAKLENWYELSSSEFLKELQKNIASANKEHTNKGLQPLAGNSTYSVDKNKGLQPIVKTSHTVNPLQLQPTESNDNKGLQPIVDKLTKNDEFEWMELFEAKKEKAQTIQSEIEKTDREIDRMVYVWYGLTGEDIKIVEDAV
ncbi:MAG: Eco57I restriction-modification methylase domain-containing protein [Prolixibacteraceae bacterium]|jgi:type I restriction-modification system DNA methylase subunit/REP element-mobilizing transposase RayT|nr:Eco57I restriction-modification methylase domain-containing protein [Prolixibacteraceae bacterium]